LGMAPRSTASGWRFALSAQRGENRGCAVVGVRGDRWQCRSRFGVARLVRDADLQHEALALDHLGPLPDGELASAGDLEDPLAYGIRGGDGAWLDAAWIGRRRDVAARCGQRRVG